MGKWKGQILSFCAKCRNFCFFEKGVDKDFQEVFHRPRPKRRKKKLDFTRFSPISTEFSTGGTVFFRVFPRAITKEKAWTKSPKLQEYSLERHEKPSQVGAFPHEMQKKFPKNAYLCERGGECPIFKTLVKKIL
jgi:hypothetical protein